MLFCEPNKVGPLPMIINKEVQPCTVFIYTVLMIVLTPIFVLQVIQMFCVEKPLPQPQITTSVPASPLRSSLHYLHQLYALAFFTTTDYINRITSNLVYANEQNQDHRNML